MRAHDIDETVLKVSGTITPEKAGAWIAQIDYWKRLGNGTRCMFIALDSQGGDVAAATDIAKAIEQWEGPTFGRVTGACQSAATLILAACQHKSAHISAQFLVHDAEWTNRQPGEAVEELERVNNSFAARLAKGSGKPTPIMRAMMQKEMAFGAFAAKAFGLVSHVLKTPLSLRAGG